jgi:Tol biopolymer transport system component
VISIAGGNQTIARTSRATLGAAFGTPTAVPITGATGSVADPVASPDELQLVYSTGQDIYLATRATTSAAFSQVGALATIDSTAADGDPALSRDGCELFFMSARGTDRDIYRATVTPQ